MWLRIEGGRSADGEVACDPACCASPRVAVTALRGWQSVDIANILLLFVLDISITGSYLLIQGEPF